MATLVPTAEEFEMVFLKYATLAIK